MGALLEYSAYLDSVPESDVELTRQVEQGAKLEGLEELKRNGLTFSEIAEVIIPPRTLKHRKAKSQRLSMEETERLLRVVRILAFADTVFGNHEKALRWLRIPDERLGNAAPLSLLRSEIGGTVVDGMLWQIHDNLYQ